MSACRGLRAFASPLVLVAILCAPAVASPADAPPAEGLVGASYASTFHRGNEAFLHGDFKAAVESYEQVVALGVVSSDLFYNLGNAYSKQGALGPAIYNYERSLEVEPSGAGADDTRYNLEAAQEAVRRKSEDRLVGAEGVAFWVRIVAPYSTSFLAWLFLGVYVGLFALLIALRFVSPGFLRVSLWVGVAFLIVGSLASGALLAGRIYFTTQMERAIVLPDMLAVHEGPDANYQTTFTIHAGLRVRITEHDQDWVRVRLQNGLEGWVPLRSVGKL